MFPCLISLMPRKTRRHRRSSSSPSLLAWPRVLIVVLPLLAAILIFTNNQNARSVLGISDTNFLNLEHKFSTNSGQTTFGQQDTPSRQKCKPIRISAFSVTGLCDSNRMGFKSASYTCEDGTTGSIVKDCMNVQSAYEKALKACNKNNKCAHTERDNSKLSPKPTHAEPTRPPGSNL